jgi:hypothetical protein
LAHTGQQQLQRITFISRPPPPALQAQLNPAIAGVIIGLGERVNARLHSLRLSRNRRIIERPQAAGEVLVERTEIRVRFGEVSR